MTPSSSASSPPNTALLTSLEHNPAVSAVTLGLGAGEVMLNGKIVGAIAGNSVKGPAPLLDGGRDPPVGDDQVGLGVSTMHQVGAHIGSVVDITFTTHSGALRTEPYRVVSQISFPQ